MKVDINSTTVLHVLMIADDSPVLGVVDPVVYFLNASGDATLLDAPSWEEVDAVNMPGLYKLTVTPAMTALLGQLTIFVSAPGCDTQRYKLLVEERVVDDMLTAFTPEGHVTIGRGRGSTRFIDQISDGVKGVRGVTVKAYARTGAVADWSTIKGMDVTDGSGNYLLWLDPGTYVCSLERAGVQLTTIDITVPEA